MVGERHEKNMSVSMEIRPLTQLEHFAQAERLQREVWGCPDVEIVPAHLLRAQALHGGCVLGGWLEQRLVALVYGFPCASDYLYSHLAAVGREVQGQGLGERIKRAQADWARERDYRRVVWTFDPLQVANARLNLNKLGAVASRYLVNYYGPLDDELNAGVDTDRFEVDWWLEASPPPRSEHVVEFPWPLPPQQRQHWRLQTRAAFQGYFAEGLSAVHISLGNGLARYHMARC
jgi:predicted GNAT superfamily acetyltransferase